MDAVMTVLLPLFVFTFLGFVLWENIHTQRKQREAWDAFGQRHGLSFTPSPLQLEGRHEGCPLRLHTEMRGSGKSRYGVTVLRLDVDDALPGDFELRREGLGNKLLKLLGSKDEELGDADFDAAFQLRNLSPEVNALLRSATVRRHLRTLASFHHFAIHAGALHVERRDVPATVEALEDFTRLVLDAAGALREAARRARGSTG